MCYHFFFRKSCKIFSFLKDSSRISLEICPGTITVKSLQKLLTNNFSKDFLPKFYYGVFPKLQQDSIPNSSRVTFRNHTSRLGFSKALSYKIFKGISRKSSTYSAEFFQDFLQCFFRLCSTGLNTNICHRF